MKQWNTLSGKELILDWRTFRENLDNSALSKEKVIDMVVEYWSNAPRSSRTIDYYTPSSWPSPWEILHYKLFCNNSISLMIYYTLESLNGFDVDVTLNLIDTDDDQYIVVFCDDKYMLNFNYFEKIDITNFKQFKVVRKYNNNEIPKIN